MKTTDFGFNQIPVDEKNRQVAAVFDSVAGAYDVMNDAMSLGMHRLWKRFAIHLSGVRAGQCVLDIAAGTGDLSRLLSEQVGERGQVWMTDINASMLAEGRNRLIDKGIIRNLHYVRANAECLPFADDKFDCLVIGFGLRNVTHKEKALASMFRVLKPGGRLIVLEFSKPKSFLQPLYDAYSFSVIPKLGSWLAHDKASYEYLVESIRMHPDQETLKNLMEDAGFENCEYHNICFGVVAVHRGWKL
jgi:demethylmenaquinone methyltransferase / 2-methoxy-6-polyprenyl-1,4-benzoquinol methylase